MNPKLRPGTAFCRCGACHQYFSGEKTFSRHRVGPQTDRRCLDQIDMSQLGWRVSSKGYWTDSPGQNSQLIEWPQRHDAEFA